MDLIDPPEDRAEALPRLPWSRDPRRGGRESGAPPQPTKRLSIDIPVELHTRIKVICARRGTKIADDAGAAGEGGSATPGGEPGAVPPPRAVSRARFRHPGR